MNLPSFIWLWKIAAWSMGLSLLAYLLLGVTGVWMFQERTLPHSSFPWFIGGRREVRSLHYTMGITMVCLVLLLLAVGIVGTLGHFGSLGHSSHLVAGLIVVALVLLSAFSTTQISTRRSWARPLHIGVNMILFGGFTWVSLTGWIVVQKYLP
ncbi:DUF4079 domain-containing protein [Nodularia sphaerocarpa]|uniref:DUF4079 domain-containing protein n=1 Tax=Nodularia sphaerocarpa TaxID=137816 RepID=UPI001EFA3BF9|nr:DUF4079 domain-containing protein [Nodularia sphaerocarpa]MDB9374480.1 DUF4079 domain-containing protein [Nodularia sphaerocarpa CS-585]MDB9377727.1 DUF4079 domain-containing protein [Nodularia sphaerocarpa CS-585A2]ULP72537.1 hypothetical protein BDGGKGIB_02181 [Nodularia sphaerocarpa UHCC 0038]